MQKPCHNGAPPDPEPSNTMTSAQDATAPNGQNSTYQVATDGLPNAIWRAFWTLAVVAALSALMVVAGNLYGERLLRANLSTSPEPLQIVIGNDVLDVPQNMFRHAEQRVPGVANRIELKVHWPDQSGYRTDLAGAFSDTDPETVQTVLISIARRQWLLDMAGRLDLVYDKAADAAVPPRTVHGLTAVPLDPAHGYIDETLYFARSPSGTLPTFIARCNEPTAGRDPLLLACETDLFFGETLEARLRFPASFLPEWKHFAAEMSSFLEELRVKP